MCGRAAGVGAILKGESLRTSQEHGRVFGIGGERFADHHARFAPIIGVAQIRDERDDRSIAIQRSVDEPEIVRGIPHVTPGAMNREAIGGGIGPARKGGTDIN
jgi:hypothetical protein